MRYWLTTHYPYRSSSHPSSVYIKDRYAKRLQADIAINDKVAFYETAGARGNGRSSIIGIGCVCAEIRRNTHHGGSPQDEGDQIWEWEIPRDQHRFGKEIAVVRIKSDSWLE